MTLGQRDEAMALMRRHAFDGLRILHGTAVGRDGRVVIVVGPPGIGKSTAVERLASEASLEIIEDGIVLVGENASGWALVETGTLDVMLRTSRMRKNLRRIVGADTSVYYRSSGHRATIRLALFRLLIVLPTYRAAVLLSRPRDDFRSRMLPAAALVVATHPCVGPTSIQVSASGCLDRHFDPGYEHLPASVDRLVISCIGRRDDVRIRLQHAVAEALDIAR